MKPGLRTFLLCFLTGIASSVATCGAFAIGATATDAMSTSKNKRVAFTELLADVDRGAVSEIRIKGTTYSFQSTRDSDVRTYETIGPKIDAAGASALRPFDPALAAPKIVFDSSF
jgi:hypothetical protein